MAPFTKSTSPTSDLKSKKLKSIKKKKLSSKEKTSFENEKTYNNNLCMSENSFTSHRNVKPIKMTEMGRKRLKRKLESNDNIKKVKRKKSGDEKSNDEILDEKSNDEGNEASLEVDGGCHGDPFFLHFSKNLPKSKEKEIEDFSNWKSSIIHWPILQRIIVEVPTLDPVKEEKPKLKKKKLLLQDDLEEDVDLPLIGVIPKAPLKARQTLSECFLRTRLVKNINPKSFSALQSEILTIISNYIDFHYPYATHDKWAKIQTVYSLHCLNHVLRTMKQVTTHTTKLNQLRRNNEDTDTLYLDQGFTRPKVLIMIPFKHTAYSVIKKMISLLGVEVKFKKRFEADFGPPEEGKGKSASTKPEDFNKTFEGDIKEDFKIGLKVTKSSLKLYSDFFDSDIIVGSPLGIRYLLEVAETDDKKDFLSSIEILVMDQADVFLMQNWEHVLIVRDSLNKMPSDLQKVIQDLYRIRRWCMDGLSSLYRQTILFSSTITDFNRVFIKKTRNFAGKMEVLNLTSSGSLADIHVSAEVILQRVKTNSSEMVHSPDAQFVHFTQVVLPLLRRKKQKQTLIYVPDYCDYVRLVNYFKEDRGTNVSTINEYMIGHDSKIAKARYLFFTGRRSYLIYSERFHFYRRNKIKGVQHIVFYGLPTYPHFFSEICNFMADEYQNPKSPPMLEPHSVLVPFQVFDATKLVGILGSAKAEEICKSDKAIHKCVTGS